MHVRLQYLDASAAAVALFEHDRMLLSAAELPQSLLYTDRACAALAAIAARGPGMAALATDAGIPAVRRTAD